MASCGPTANITELAPMATAIQLMIRLVGLGAMKLKALIANSVAKG